METVHKNKHKIWNYTVKKRFQGNITQCEIAKNET